MIAVPEKKVGRFAVEVELANNDDLARARHGDLPEDRVRRVKLMGVVDSGAAYLVLPSAIAKKLGISASAKIGVRYANGKAARRDQVEGVYLAHEGRHGVFRAILEPARDTALIGAIVLEDLDLLVDCTRQRLYPRDPKTMLAEIE